MLKSPWECDVPSPGEILVLLGEHLIASYYPYWTSRTRSDNNWPRGVQRLPINWRAPSDRLSRVPCILRQICSRSEINHDYWPAKAAEKARTVETLAPWWWSCERKNDHWIDHYRFFVKNQKLNHKKFSGHEDGQIRFWQGDGVTMKHIHRIKTSKLFDKESLNSLELMSPLAIRLVEVCVPR